MNPSLPPPLPPHQGVGQRLLLARKHLGLTQQDAAERLGISRTALSQLESGISQPSFDTLRQAHSLFGLSYDYLLDGRNSAPPTEHLPVAYGPDIISVTVDAAAQPNIVLVPVKAHAGYATNRLLPEALRDLPAFHLPGYQFRNQTFRAFEVAGDSMEPTLHNGDTVICSLVTNYLHLWPGELYVVVLPEDVLVKRVREVSKATEELVLASDNAYYSDIRLNLSDLAEVWRVKARITEHLPSPRGQ